jgi:hypothetical protein
MLCWSIDLHDLCDAHKADMLYLCFHGHSKHRIGVHLIRCSTANKYMASP